VSIFSRSERPQPVDPPQADKKYPAWITAMTWAIAVMMIALMGFSLYQYLTGRSLLALIPRLSRATASAPSDSSLPEYSPGKSYLSIGRTTNPDTVLPAGVRQTAVEYEITTGDSLFRIAEEYEVKPESIMYANYDVLRDDPHLISVGSVLKIPPVDGIWYEWKEGDKLEEVAAKYKANVEDILLYPGNDLDITNPVIEPGTYIMIPGGYRELRPWVVPVAAGDNAGVTHKIDGPGSCSPTGGYNGSMSFIWPTPYSGQLGGGNDFWAGHMAIDAMCYEGDSIFASDSGVVIYAGPISGGYGNMVAIDHLGTGYMTLYAHLSSISVACGSSVSRGQTIGYCGSTGNSTGAHLHFEVRQDGSFVNPWHVLQ